jgi:hypothetical protein
MLASFTSLFVDAWAIVILIFVVLVVFAWFFTD